MRTQSCHGDTVKAPRNPMMRRSFADGGEIDPEMQKQIDANKAKYNPAPKPGMFSGLFGSSPAPTPAPAPAPAPAPGIIDAAANRRNELNKVANYANGGSIAQVPPDTGTPNPSGGIRGGKAVYGKGGKIKGPGTPTSDSIPAKVQQTGEPIQVSNKERIVSQAQDALLEHMARKMGFDSLDAMLEHGTGTPVGPTMKAGKAHAATGDSFDNIADRNPLTQLSVKPASNLTSSAVAPPSSEMSAPAPAATGDPFANAVGSGIDAIKGAAQYGVGAALVPIGNVKDAVANTVASAVGATRPNPSNNAEAGLQLMQSGVDNFKTAGKEFDIAKNPLVQAAGWTPNAPAPAPVAATPTPAATTKPAPVVAPPAATPAPEAAPAPAAPMPAASRVGNSFTEQNTVENPANPLQTINLSDNNASMAKANAVRQEMIDAQAGYRAEPGSSGGRIADSGRAEGDALLDKWGRQHDAKVAMDMAAANPKSAQAIASTYGATVAGENALVRDATDRARNVENNSTLRRGQDVGLQESQGRNAVISSGQELTAKTAANQLAGNPMTNALVGAQTVNTAAEAASKEKSQALLDELLNPATTPERKTMLLSVLGKGDKYVAMPNIKTYNEYGQVTGEVPGGMGSTHDGTVKAAGGKAQAGPSQADLEFTAKKHGMTVEQLKAKLATQRG